MNKVRFNLGRGSNYMKWKIENTVTKDAIYLDPEEVSLTLVNCTLHNNRNRSEEIFLGSNKSVCAWVLCEKILVDSPKEPFGEHIRYNPRVAPHWTHKDKDVDGQHYKILRTHGKGIYCNTNR
jgi:hypothetical protein